MSPHKHTETHIYIFTVYTYFSAHTYAYTLTHTLSNYLIGYGLDSAQLVWLLASQFDPLAIDRPAPTNTGTISTSATNGL